MEIDHPNQMKKRQSARFAVLFVLVLAIVYIEILRANENHTVTTVTAFTSTEYESAALITVTTRTVLQKAPIVSVVNGTLAVSYTPYPNCVTIDYYRILDNKTAILVFSSSGCAKP